MSRRRRQTFVGSSIGAVLASATLVLVNLAGAPGIAAAAQPGTARCPARAVRIWRISSARCPETRGCRRRVQAQRPTTPSARGPTRPARSASSRSTGRRQRSSRSPQRDIPAGDGGAAWESIGPSRALYPFTELRDSFSYVPNEYVAGGRTTSIAISNVCAAGGLPGVDHARRRRDLAYRRHPGDHARVDLSRRPAGDQRGWGGHDRRQRRDWQHDLRRHRRGEHLRVRLCRRRGALPLH